MQLWKLKEHIFDEKSSKVEVQMMEQAEAKQEYKKRTGNGKEDENVCYLPEGDIHCCDDTADDVDSSKLRRAAAPAHPQEHSTY